MTAATKAVSMMTTIMAWLFPKGRITKGHVTQRDGKEVPDALDAATLAPHPNLQPNSVNMAMYHQMMQILWSLQK